MKRYLQNKKILAEFHRKASPDFWDEHWDNKNIRNGLLNPQEDIIFFPQISKYLSKGAKILEGGCGQASLVSLFHKHGYNITGVDFAEDTISKIKKIVPFLNVQCADVRNLPFGEDSFDAYISGGVIEHFYKGYDEIINEANRVLKHNGFLFITFPSQSLLRKLKMVLGLYKNVNYTDIEAEKNGFYQYYLNDRQVLSFLQEKGFFLISKHRIDGVKGLKDEIGICKTYLQKFYTMHQNSKKRIVFNNFAKIFAWHMTLLIMQKIN